MTAADRTIDAEAFRHVISHFTSGVAVITTSAGGRDHGMTASAVSSLSMDPPMLLVCLNTNSPTQAAVAETGAFTVNILEMGQGDLARQFAAPRDDKFDGVCITRGPLGQPGIREALARLECRTVQDVTGGTHRVFLAEVVSADARTGSPLAYYRGKFGRFELQPDLRAYEEEYDAKLAIDIGAVTLVANRIDSQQLSDLRETADRALVLSTDASKVTEHLKVMGEFQEKLVALPGNAALIDAYRRLEIVGRMTAAIDPDADYLGVLAARRIELVQALESGDLASAIALLRQQRDEAVEAKRHALARG